MRLPDEVAQQTDIFAVARRYNILVSGRIARCPFHYPDASPSLRLYTENQQFYCFGCGRYGTAVDLVMHFEQCSFREALEILGIQWDPQQDTVLHLPDPSIYGTSQVFRPPDRETMYRHLAITVRPLWVLSEFPDVLQDMLNQFDYYMEHGEPALAEDIIYQITSVALSQNST